MPRMIFVNLPVKDITTATSFYTALGFEKNPAFSDEATSCMIWSDTIFVMLLSHDKWRTFTSRPIPSTDSSEVLLAVSFDSRDEVDSFCNSAAANGGTADVNPTQEHGFMYGRSLADPDGHVWEAFWMDPEAVPSE